SRPGRSGFPPCTARPSPSAENWAPTWPAGATKPRWSTRPVPGCWARPQRTKRTIRSRGRALGDHVVNHAHVVHARSVGPGRVSATEHFFGWAAEMGRFLSVSLAILANMCSIRKVHRTARIALRTTPAHAVDATACCAPPGTYGPG